MADLTIFSALTGSVYLYELASAFSLFALTVSSGRRLRLSEAFPCAVSRLIKEQQKMATRQYFLIHYWVLRAVYKLLRRHHATDNFVVVRRVSIVVTLLTPNFLTISLATIFPV